MTCTCTAICWLAVAANMICSVCGIYLTDLLETQHAPFDPDDGYAPIIMRVVFINLQLFRSCAWIFPIAVSHVTCSMLQWQFDELTEKFAKIKHKPVVFGKLEKLVNIIRSYVILF